MCSPHHAIGLARTGEPFCLSTLSALVQTRVESRAQAVLRCFRRDFRRVCARSDRTSHASPEKTSAKTPIARSEKLEQDGHLVQALQL